MDDLTKEFLAESQDGLERMERGLTALEKSPNDRELIAEIFRSVHTIKGTTGFLGFGRLEKLAHAGENLLGGLRDSDLKVTAQLIDGLLRLLDGLRAILTLIETTGGEGQHSLDDDRDLLALMIALKTPGATASDVTPPTLPPARIESCDAPMPTPAMADKTLRIDVEVLNRMMNLVGELVLTRNQILQSTPASPNFGELAQRLNSVTADLREAVMQARMQPVGHLFGKFPRMVRDLAQTCDRKVRLEFEGQDTGLDKSLLEAIKDPLTHAVRNSVDHGIETPGARLLVGKPAEGVVRLRAYHHGGSVVIEVIDDGAGISTERVLDKAVDRGLITSAQAQSMTRSEALQLIFLPGFSTASEVTNVSGRGVGMDVVRNNVEKVGGSVDVLSEVGVGTTLRLRVPLTLAIVPALVVRSANQNFALPQSALVELVYVAARDAGKSIEHIGSSALYRLREHLLPLVWLDRLLQLERATSAGAEGFYIAVLEAEGHLFGLVVDDLRAPEEIVVKPLSSALRSIGLFSGATVLGNGMLAMILDVGATAHRASVIPRETRRAAELQLPQAASVDDAPLISMVIFEGRNDEPMAMPMSAMERIECVPITGIEYAGGRPVLQYRGELLPLEDDDDVLGSRSSGKSGLHVVAPAGREEAMVTVLICTGNGLHGVKRIGIVARRVLDVSTGSLLPAQSAAQGHCLAMVKGRVTTVHRGFAHSDARPLQEVA